MDEAERSRAMNENEKSKKKWIDTAVKLSLSLAMFFPVYALFYLIFPASLVALYIISAILLAAFAPREDLKKKFLS
jgi:hypothetical protein